MRNIHIEDIEVVAMTDIGVDLRVGLVAAHLDVKVEKEVVKDLEEVIVAVDHLVPVEIIKTVIEVIIPPADLIKIDASPPS